MSESSHEPYIWPPLEQWIKDSTDASTRELSLHERYSASRELSNCTPVIVHAAILPPALAPRTLIVFKEAVERAVSRLLEIQPILGCTVQFALFGARPPRWRTPGTQTSTVSPRTIVEVVPPEVNPFARWSKPSNAGHTLHDMRHTSYTRARHAPSSSSRSRTIENLLLDGLEAGKKFEILEKGPLWKVHIPTDGPCGPDGQPVRALVLIMHHVLADGIGARNLLAALLTELSAELRMSAETPEVSEISVIPQTSVAVRTPVPMPFPPPNEDTMDIRPSYGHLVSEACSSIAKSLPRCITPTVYAIWPNSNVPYGEPWLAAQRLALFSIPAAVVQGVKDTARRRGVKTLHPVLQAATLVALRTAFFKDDGDALLLDDDAKHPLQIKILTPVSLRNEDLGHPRACGNYVAPFTHDYPVSALRSGPGWSPTPAAASTSVGLKFWDVALDFAEDITDPAKRKRAAATIGMLAYVTDGWESWLLKKMQAEAPFGASLEISNLGVFTTDEECGIEQQEGFEVAWAQTASPLGESLSLNLISAKGGPLVVSASWREGMHADAGVQAFLKAWQNVMGMVARDEIAEQALIGEVEVRGP